MRACALIGTTRFPSRSVFSRSISVVSPPPDSGAPSAFRRPMTRSCSADDSSSQSSSSIRIRRTTT
ncbi:hypothetical protein SFUMM280S_11447 [Streptomyces fumanus]